MASRSKRDFPIFNVALKCLFFFFFCCRQRPMMLSNNEWNFLRKQKLLHEDQDSMAFWQRREVSSVPVARNDSEI